MIAQTILRDIREGRKKNFSSKMPHFDEVKHNQLLLLELPFEIDIISLMEMWRKERSSKESIDKTPFTEVLRQWAKAAGDRDNERNRQNAIKGLVKKGVLYTNVNENGNEMNVYEFLRYNYSSFKQRNSAVLYRSPKTKKAYEVAFRSLVRFITKFRGFVIQKNIKLKPLKRGIRALELAEIASIFEQLETHALKSKSEKGLRDLLIFRLVFYAGESITIKDVLALQRENIDFDQGIVRFKKKSVICSASFMKLLKSYLGPRRKFLFSESFNIDEEQNLLNKALSRACKKAGILKDVFPQCIQRTCIYVLKKEGVINY